jgi:hypothetical protein
MNSLTAFNPQSPYAHAIFNMTVVSLVILAVIFAVVGGLISYAMARFRWREGHAAEKPASSTSATSRTSTTGLLPATFRACNLCSRVALNLSTCRVIPAFDGRVETHNSGKFSRDLDGGCPQFAIQFGKRFNNLRRAKSGMVNVPHFARTLEHTVLPYLP